MRIVITGKDFIAGLSKDGKNFTETRADIHGVNRKAIPLIEGKYNPSLDWAESYLDVQTYKTFFEKYMVSSGSSPVRVTGLDLMIEAYVQSPFINSGTQNKACSTYAENLYEMLGIKSNSFSITKSAA